MITLKIKKAGYTIDIPGLPACRSPVEIDVSKLDIRVVAMSLKTSGISDYEIVADIGKGGKEVYTKKSFEKTDSEKSIDLENIDKRFNKIEKMISDIQKVGNLDSKKEQITDKLDKIENILSKRSTLLSKEKSNQDPEIEEIEEVDSFIPDINISKMKIESKNLKNIKQESDDLDDTSDALSSLLKKK